MTRLKVLQIRLAVTATVLLLVFGVVRLFWYPDDYFIISGAATPFLVLVALALVIGPGLTTFVFKPGKKGLVGDIWLLAGAEFLVLCLALSIIYERRPFYAVFAVDRFEAVMHYEVDPAQIDYPEFYTRPGHEPRLVYAELPVDPEDRSRLIDETIFEGKADIDRRPEFWKPYASGIAQLKSVATPLANLLDDGDPRAVDVRRWLSKQDGGPQDYIYLPLRGRNGDAVMILDADIGYPVDTLAIDPW